MDDTIHKESYDIIYIPACIDDVVQVLTFPGGKSEGSFRNFLKKQFGVNPMTSKQQSSFKGLIEDQVQQATKGIQSTTAPSGPDSTSSSSSTSTPAVAGTSSSTIATPSPLELGCLIDSACDGNYQIIPLTLPNRENGFHAINCYIDSVGKIKELDKNSRASRLTTDDIRGDCYVCKTFDDEETEFGRRSLNMEAYEKLMECPPDKAGRWSETNALKSFASQSGGGTDKKSLIDQMECLKNANASVPMERKCENCGREGNSSNVDFKKCARCSKVLYCGVDCQKADWRFHKRICKSV
eukprot:GHVQ01000909.1.p1 GENE.GHVQ01000909.1~~GHVQ01000909.1.p1  ORF type:complete len:297 (+),score=32.14 GHVQ01000909.1:83-973(+)